MDSVTVVIPCTASYEVWLADAVKSVRTQTVPCQLVIVGYGLSGLWLSTPRTTVCQLTTPFNLSEAYNYGIAHATTPYVVCLDADNVLDHTFVERCLPHAADGVVVTPGFYHLETPSDQWFPPQNASSKDWLDHNCAITSALFSREDWTDAGGFHPELYLDWDFWIRLYSRGVTFTAVPQPLLGYRRHNTSVTARTRNHEQERRDFRQRHMALFRGL